MKGLTLLAGIITSLTASAQYYYKDIIGTQETAATMQAYQKANVARVAVTTYDADGTKADGFSIAQEFSSRTSTLRTTTRAGAGTESILLSTLNAQGQVIKTVDSSRRLVSTTTYTYDGNGLLQSIVLMSTDSSGSYTQREEHQWRYTAGKPERMVRVRNGNDSTIVNFKRDEAGNVIEEQGTRFGVTDEPVYYYYDSQNRLTDIVRYNKRARRLLPEYMFEYNTSNQVIQRITVPSNGSDYLIWRWQYDNRGLKLKEAIYDKQKQLTGKIEYAYTFGS